MPTYRVEITGNFTFATTVEADDEEAAREAAYDEMRNNPDQIDTDTTNVDVDEQ